MPNHPVPVPKHDPVAFTFLIAMAVATAVVTGASLSGVASGAVQDMLRTAGFGQDSEIKAEQRRQSLALAKVETSFGLVRGEVAMLNARIADAEKPHQEAAKEAPASGHVDTSVDLAALRTSLDEHAERNRNEFSAVNKRIDWLEKLVYSPDATGSVAAKAAGSARGGGTARNRRPSGSCCTPKRASPSSRARPAPSTSRLASWSRTSAASPPPSASRPDTGWW